MKKERVAARLAIHGAVALLPQAELGCRRIVSGQPQVKKTMKNPVIRRE
ncbi:MAG TPA: hypothetical protein VLM91_21765 [Candidatus Methylomirabilis sp.]|nr:hypothetical protein [Candidatus Methylomirabilis sp.]